MSFDYIPENAKSVKQSTKVVDSFVFDWNAVEAIAA